MRIGRSTNNISCEFGMQSHFNLWLKEKDNLFSKDEVRVNAINRIADFLIVKNKNQLINVEAKCNDFSCMMEQLEDHSVYCDYSFAFIPDYSLTPKWFKEKLFNKGFGLIVYNYKNGCITEVLEAHHNKPKNKKLRRKYLEILLTEQIKLKL